MVDEMFDTRKSGHKCGHENEVVAYLYGELAEADRTRFEAHLEECVYCVDEIAAFSAVRLSIHDWKNSESPVTPPAAVEVRPGFLESVFAWIRLTPSFAKGAAGFAALVLVLVFGWLISGTFVDPPQVTEVPGPAAPKAEPVEPRENAVPEAELTEAVPPDVSPESPGDPPIDAHRVRKSPDRRPEVAKDKTPPKRKQTSPELRENQLAEKDDIPRLSEFEEIDDFADESLRLTDLFADFSDDR